MELNKIEQFRKEHNEIVDLLLKVGTKLTQDEFNKFLTYLINGDSIALELQLRIENDEIMREFKERQKILVEEFNDTKKNN